MCDSLMQTVSFKDDNHHKRSFVRARELMLQKNLCDVEITIHGQQFYYHSVILASCSEYFSNIFTVEQKNSTVKRLTINEFNSDVLRHVIEYCYTGSLEISKEKVRMIFSIASLFIIEPLVQSCCNIIKKSVNIHNCLEILELSKLHLCTELESMAIDFVGGHFDEIFSTSSFLNINFNSLIDLISSDNLIVSSEREVFLAVKKWVEHDEGNRDKYKLNLLEQVRLPLIPLQKIFDEVQPFCGSQSKCQKLIIEAIQYISLPNRQTQLLSVISKPRILQNTMLIAGGWNAGTYDSVPFTATSTIEIYNTITKQWIKYLNTGITRRGCGVGLIGNEIIIAGGLDGENISSNVECFNLMTGEQISVPPMQKPRSFPLTVEYENCMYCFGGSPVESSSSIEKYDPITKTWTLFNSTIEIRSGSGGVVIGDELFVVGGGSPKSTRLVDAFCFTTRQWRKCAPLTFPRVLAGVNVIDGFIYAIGGNNSFDVNDQFLSSVEKYDPSLDKWTTIASINSARYSVAAGTLGRNLFAVGGADGRVALKTVESYDPKTNAWTSMPPLYQPRELMRVFSVPISYLDNKFV